MTEYEEEVQSRIDAKREDADYMADNDQPSDAQLRIDALEDMVAMGDDYGGAYEEGISPTHLTADGRVDHAAMKRQAEHIADLRKQWAEWVKMRKMAMRELKQMEDAHVA